MTLAGGSARTTTFWQRLSPWVAGMIAIGLHYADFHQVPDEEVLAVLDSLARPPPAAAPPS